MKSIILSGLIICLIVSWTFSATTTNESDEMINLKNEMSTLQNQITNMENQINNIKSSIYNIKNEEAVFTPSSKGYQTLRANVGYFVVSLDNLTKYANGYKARFSIGNPNLMTFNGVKAIVKWGRALSKDEDFDTWYSSLKIATIDINNPLLPGVWNKATIVLSPAEPKETGFITISLVTDQISLHFDPRRTN